MPTQLPCVVASCSRKLAVAGVPLTVMPVCEPLRPPAEAVIDWTPGGAEGGVEGALAADEGLAGGQGGRWVGTREGHGRVEVERRLAEGVDGADCERVRGTGRGGRREAGDVELGGGGLVGADVQVGGRGATPRWSVSVVAAPLPASSAGLPASRATVWVGPPLLARRAELRVDRVRRGADLIPVAAVADAVHLRAVADQVVRAAERVDEADHVAARCCRRSASCSG